MGKDIWGIFIRVKLRGLAFIMLTICKLMAFGQKDNLCKNVIQKLKFVESNY